jgi:Bacterial mobilisation protein (MobC)
VQSKPHHQADGMPSRYETAAMVRKKDRHDTSAHDTGQRSPREQLCERVIFRLTQSENTVLMEKVATSGMSASEFLRECVLTNRTKIVARQPASADRKRILFVINKTGNNLNQLAHVANTQQLAGRISETTFVAILDELELIHQLLKAHLHRVD